jgi:signal transduction histidine kinase
MEKRMGTGATPLAENLVHELAAEAQVHFLQVLQRLNVSLLEAQSEADIVLRALPLLLGFPAVEGVRIYRYLPENKVYQIWHSLGRASENPLPVAELLPDSPIRPDQPLAILRLSLHTPAQEKLGALEFEAAQPAFGPQEAAFFQQAAGSLSLALHAARQRQQEAARRQEAELMRDMLGALASSADLNHALEIILVNLRSLVSYDTARLFLLDRYAQLPPYRQDGGINRSHRGIFPADDPVVLQLRERGHPLIIADISGDARFREWPEMQPIRGWLGVPVFGGEEMLGFLSLGSLQPDQFSPADAELLEIFGDQIGRILERAWLHEQQHNQSEDLEVLSKITLTLGQIDSQEGIFPAIIDQITRFYGASGGTFLFPEKFGAGLFVRFSQEPGLAGMVLPPGEDLFWQVFQSGQPQQVPDIAAFLRKNPQEHYQRLLSGSHAAVLIPLAAQADVLGVLLLNFSQDQPLLLSPALVETLASIAGLFLQRAMLLDGLEKQLQVRTRQLSTLYEIGRVTGETVDRPAMLEQVLQISLTVMDSNSGWIALLQDVDDLASAPVLALEASQGLSEAWVAYLDRLPQEGAWENLLAAEDPLVVPNLREELRLPDNFRQLGQRTANACILAPIRVGRRPLGVVGVVSESILGYSIEDITLFMNIADQIGGAIERSHLARQARQAAVMEERQRLARELHDSITQLLYSQVLFAGAGQRLLPAESSENLQQHLQRIEQGAQQALKEMRLLVYELRPSVYLQEGLVSALRYRLEAVERRSGMNASLRVEGRLSLDEALELALYRIAEEALNNTLKHSSAENVTIKIQESGERLLLVIEDDGRGFDPEMVRLTAGMGLQNIRDRVQALQGQLHIQSDPDQGTRITVEIEMNR